MSEQSGRILAEMGITPAWRLRDAARVETSSPEPAPEVLATVEATPAISLTRAGDEISVIVEPASLLPAEPLLEPASAMPAAQAPSGVACMDWPALSEAVSACRACTLCERRKQAVLGVGDVQADWLFVGEGPGADEDERGEPFVGQAGKLLDAMLAAIQLKRGENVYIANAVKCRPPGNRTPEANEIEACRPFLERQIALIRPKLIVALGRPAAQTLIGGEVKIGAARGRLFSYLDVPVIVSYHPAYLLRNLEDKARAWEDLCFAQDQMRRLLTA
ncbi:uracil-DNA glycosylase [Uliginosibacterium sp. 31-16]|uniref:uracil-DNA glycosylase n=1 Tax=Uliginosibacterium sp. 31-16 TaxID=3068315 RepID=UPI00273F63B6|nr:uracil-DNA glycosylase [Uliginosibacterium sp. 31-16]MDP5239552.1 uracil-DNA glycosylase [Uliginosibacterium sp. 31-16]